MDTPPKTMEQIEREAVESSLLRHGGNRRLVREELCKSRKWLLVRIKAWNLPIGKPGRPKTD